MLIGPDSLGHFHSTIIRTIERKRLRVPVCSAGQSASFALRKTARKDVRKGMVVLSKQDKEPKVHKEFVAEGADCPERKFLKTLLTYHSSDLKPCDYHQDQVSGNASCWPCLANMCNHRH